MTTTNRPPASTSKVAHFDTVALAVAATNIVDGQFVQTAGRTTAHDGGANLYVYHATESGETEDGGFYIFGAGDSYIEATDKTVANVLQFGAIGDGVTDDSTAITAAIEAAGVGGEVKFPSGKTYLISSTIGTTHDYQTWDMTGATIYVEFAGVGVDIGEASGRTRHVRLIGGDVLKTNVTPAEVVDWTSGNIGVRFRNCNWCSWYEVGVTGFEKGLQVLGDDAEGSSYNKFFIRRMTDNKFGISVLADGAGSFSNDNSFYGGRVGCSTGAPDASSGYQLHLDRSNSGNVPNTNRFANIALEGNVTAGAPAAAVYNNGDRNQFNGLRYEGTWATSILIIEGPDFSVGGNVYGPGRGFVGLSQITLAGVGGVGSRCTIFGENGRYFGGGSGNDDLMTLRQINSNSNPALVVRDLSNTIVYQVRSDGRPQIGGVSNAFIRAHGSASATLSFGTVAANSSVERTISGVTGATIGNACYASPNSVFVGADLIWSAYVSATGVVTVRLANPTTSGVVTTDGTWTADAWRH